MAARMLAASPLSRRLSPGRNQLKQPRGFFASVCCGSSSAKPAVSASPAQPVPEAITAAFCVQPCSSTTRGAPGERPGGSTAKLRSAPGLSLRPVMSISSGGVERPTRARRKRRARRRSTARDNGGTEGHPYGNRRDMPHCNNAGKPPKGPKHLMRTEADGGRDRD